MAAGGDWSARASTMAASGVVDALTWIEEHRTRDAFLALIARQHIIGGDPSERLPVLFEESVAAAEEITEALGSQVRSAVELLIQSFSESAADAARRGLPDPLPARTHDTYEAAVTVMMRVVFLLFAEERGLLPSGDLFEQGYGIARELDRLIARETEDSEEALDSTSLTWHRLLATSQALFSGASFESLRMPAYGGSLFDPARFQFLTALNEQGTLAVTVSDRVMLHVLRSVQIADIKGEARRISFRDIDVEQIGYIYEGLLGYTAKKVDQTYVGLRGTTGVEPEITLAKLEEVADANPDPKRLAAAIRAWVEVDQPSAKAASAAALAKAITADVDPSVVGALTQAVGDDPELRGSGPPVARPDPTRPTKASLRRLARCPDGQGNAVAEERGCALHAKVTGRGSRLTCASATLLLTGAAPDCGRGCMGIQVLGRASGPQGCGHRLRLGRVPRRRGPVPGRRVVEAWIAEDPAKARPAGTSTRRAIRQVVANCLYGADINDMAVEMQALPLARLPRPRPTILLRRRQSIPRQLRWGSPDLDQSRRINIDPRRAHRSASRLRRGHRRHRSQGGRSSPAAHFGD